MVQGRWLVRVRRGPGANAGGRVSRSLREIAAPFVAAAPAGVRVKQALTSQSSSRWAGAITRASEDAWQLGSRNLAAGLSVIVVDPAYTSRWGRNTGSRRCVSTT